LKSLTTLTRHHWEISRKRGFEGKTIVSPLNREHAGMFIASHFSLHTVDSSVKRNGSKQI
jgi:hypothetical protein